MKLSFDLLNTDGRARTGSMRIGNTQVLTPVFMPVGTAGTVKALTMDEVRSMGYNLILGNTYHLYLRPGHESIRQFGGLGRFTAWDGLYLTDSGGFQVFSLGDLAKVSDEGVEFASHIDGSRHFFSPEKAIEIQESLGSHIMMVLDECIALPASRDKAARALERSARWAERCLQARTSEHNLFGIVQGADYEDLRQLSAEMTTLHDFDGFAIGGLSVGESKEIMYSITQHTADLLPQHKPRYLMGVGDPLDLLEGIAAGVDMFDCVLPTRIARNGALFTSRGRISIKNSKFRHDSRPLDEDCDCQVCQTYTRAYLRHIFIAKEILSSRLNSYHNLYFLRNLTYQAQKAITEGRFAAFKADFTAGYTSSDTA